MLARTTSESACTNASARSRRPTRSDAFNRDPSDRGPFLAHLAEAVGGRVALATFLDRVGYGSSLTKRLARFPSFSLLQLVGLLAVALRWRVFGGKSGATNAKDRKLENAMLDVEYAMLASYSRGFVTKETRDARDAYEGILHVAGRVWSTV